VRPRRGAIAPDPVAGEEQEADQVAPPEPKAAAVAPGPPSNAPRWIAAVVVAALAIALLYWGADQYMQRRAIQRAAADSAARVAVERVRQTDSIARVRRDSIVRDSLNGLGAAAVDSFPVYAAANSADSASAVGYAILLSKYNTKSGAILDLFGRFARLPAATYGVESPSRFYLMLAGAFPTRLGAESLLTQLRASKTLAQGFGSVDSYPLAFLVDSGLAPRVVPARLTRYAARGLPIYALRQPNGTVRLFFGAYANPEQAALAVPQVREAGIRPLLMYRTGRVF
jgi:hypothetical protein